MTKEELEHVICLEEKIESLTKQLEQANFYLKTAERLKEFLERMVIENIDNQEREWDGYCFGLNECDMFTCEFDVSRIALMFGFDLEEAKGRIKEHNDIADYE